MSTGMLEYARAGDGPGRAHLASLDPQAWHARRSIEKLTVPELGELTRDERLQLDALGAASAAGWRPSLPRRIGAAGARKVLHPRLAEVVAELLTPRPLKLPGEVQADLLRAWGVEPTVDERDGNLLLYGGASCQWQTLIGNGTATAGQSLTYFNNAQAAIGVGDSTTAAAATQTDLQAASNKLRRAMDATYPLHTDGVVVGAATATFRSTFATADANWAWQEWILANSATLATGRSLNRKVESLGTKTSAAAWTFTIALTLA